MGVMTLTNFRDEVEAAMGFRALGTSITDPWIMAGYYEVAGAIEHEELVLETTFPTVAHTAAYATPTRLWSMIVMKDETNNNVLTYIPKHEYFRLTYNVDGLPTKWTRVGAQIRLVPQPTAIYTIREVYMSYPAALANPGDVTVLTPNWDRAIWMMGVSHGMLGRGETATAIQWYNRALNYMKSQLPPEEAERLAKGFSPIDPAIFQRQQGG